jgi:glucose/mannose transport system permease protein
VGAAAALDARGWRDAWTPFRRARQQLQARDPGDVDLDRPRLAQRLRALQVALPGRDVVFTFFLFGLFIPYQAVMIPLTQLFDDVQFPDGIPRLVFAHVVYGIPITTLIFRNYYATIPDELMEAARMDRAGMLRTYCRSCCRVSAPAFVVAAIWQFTSIWNDFLFAVFIITDRPKWPVTVALNTRGRLSRHAVHTQMAGALLASLPTLVVYILLGRYFVRGLLAGSLKG